MNGQRGQVSRLVGRALLSLVAAAMTAVLLAPTAPVASASPIGDAEAAMMAAWEKAGGATSTLGARKGDVYPVGDGFALEFDGGKMYFTPDTGAHYLYGPILNKYEELGGPVNSDLGFPTINEVPGLAGPDSRVGTFAAGDNPVIFWTPDRGAFVVRGAINAAWDRLGSSGGVLGAPIADETYAGDVASQKFTGGSISWNRKTKEFTTDPGNLGDQLKDLQITLDPTAAINMAWRAAGGAAGSLGAKKGGQYPIGGDGIAQDFNGGKIFYSPATGANAVEGPILQKYESLGGPVSSDLGFPTSNETDGGITPASRIVEFSAADKPVIFWTPEHGAFVVRGAMKAAWDKLKGPTGKLGAPVADQTVDGDVISQKFAGGKISWNRAKNSFSTDPANLAPLLSGVQVTGQNAPATAGPAPQDKKFTWHWWWLVGILPVLLLIVMCVLVVLSLRRRRAAAGEPAAYDQLDRHYEHEDQHEHEGAAGYDAGPDGHWGSRDEGDFGSEQFRSEDQRPQEPAAPESGAAPRVSWPRGAAGVGSFEQGARDSDVEPEPHIDELAADYASPHEDDDPDSVDTTPIPSYGALTEALAEADGARVEESEVLQEPDVPETVAPDEFAPEALVPSAVAPGAPEAPVSDGGVPERPDESDGREAIPDTFYPTSGGAAGEPSDAGEPSSPDIVLPDAGSQPPAPRRARSGRHAAADPDDDEDYALSGGHEPALNPVSEPVTAAAAGPTAAVRPTIHLPLEDDPYRPPNGYPIKASARFGLYYTPSSPLYHDTLAELWFTSEETARANGFVRAD
ncbi:hypothetical protein H7J50_19060 [Mycobacterium intermedium]|uniref:sunset domain-containing protein n=1 Tax=Mycobacterium intermedium TaxID=28445 RepID=UPI000A83CCD6|nr:hypothetical protein [Mycobacterium intermedium]MCV6965892.1 hypothetical protein [Mycobacterium intermedium]